MELEKQVYRLLWEYPTAFANRTEALHQLFLVGGGGYSWQDGELRADGDMKELTPFEELTVGLARSYADITEMSEKFDGPELREENAQRLAKEIRETQQGRREIDQRMYSTPLMEHLSPLWDSTNLCNLPDDIKSDWLAGAQEVVDLALISPSSAVVMAYAKSPEFRELEYQSNQKYLRLAQVRIDELKAARGL